MSVDTERPVDRGEGHTQVPAGQKDRRVAQPPKLRRRTALVAASIAAVCLGGLLGAFAWTATSDTRSVVAVRSAVERGAVIGRECLIGAGALIPEGKVIPDRSLVMGSPGKVVRQLSDQEAAMIRLGCVQYTERARRYRRELQRLPDQDAPVP